MQAWQWCDRERLRSKWLVKRDLRHFQDSIWLPLEPTHSQEYHAPFPVDAYVDFVRVPDHESVETPTTPLRQPKTDGRFDIERFPADQ
jgi:hypothetical protein